MKPVTLLLIIFTSVINVYAQPDSLWSNLFDRGYYDYCNAMKQTQDGGYILGGTSQAPEGFDFDFWVVKTDASGDSLWSRTYGPNVDEECTAIVENQDGTFLLAGTAGQFSSAGYNFYVVKIGLNGDSLWSRRYGGPFHDRCSDAKRTSDGGYVLAGSTSSFGAGESDFWLLRTNSSGDSIWSRTFGNSDTDSCNRVELTSDGGYVLAGKTQAGSLNNYDMWLVKIDSEGNSDWDQNFGNDWGNDNCYAIQQTADGGFILAGEMKRTVGSTDVDFYLVKTDAEGEEQWSRCYGDGGDDRFHAVYQLSDGGYILAGYQSYENDVGIWRSKYCLMRVNANGDSLWSVMYGGVFSSTCKVLEQTLDGGFALAGDSDSFGGQLFDFWLVKTDAFLSLPESPVFIPQYFTLSAFPNPFNPVTTIAFDLAMRAKATIRVYNLNGQLVTTLLDETMNAGSHSVAFDGSNLSSGSYFARLSTPEQTAVQKIVLMK